MLPAPSRQAEFRAYWSAELAHDAKGKGKAIDRSAGKDSKNLTVDTSSPLPPEGVHRSSPLPRASTNALVSPSPEPPAVKIEDDIGIERGPIDLSSLEPDRHMLQEKSHPAPNAIGHAATVLIAQNSQSTPKIMASGTATSPEGFPVEARTPQPPQLSPNISRRIHRQPLHQASKDIPRSEPSLEARRPLSSQAAPGTQDRSTDPKRPPRLLKFTDDNRIESVNSNETKKLVQHFLSRVTVVLASGKAFPVQVIITQSLQTFYTWYQAEHSMAYGRPALRFVLANVHLQPAKVIPEESDDARFCGIKQWIWDQFVDAFKRKEETTKFGILIAGGLPDLQQGL